MSKSITVLLDLALPGGRISIRDGNDVSENQRFGSENKGTREVLLLLDEMLRKNGLSKDDLREIICTRGPGGYTGIRVALATAKGLERALGLDAYAYPLFEVLLYQAETGKSAAAIGAGRNELLCVISGSKTEDAFLIDRIALFEAMRERGVEKLILAPCVSENLGVANRSDIRLEDASDNVIGRLLDFHRSGEGRSQLTPIYGRELLKN